METTEPRAIQAEGARIGVVTCLRCGAALVIDPADTGKSAIELHAEFHDEFGRKAVGLEELEERLDEEEGRG